MEEGVNIVRNGRVRKMVNEMFKRQTIAATIGKHNPWLRNDVLTKPLSRLLLLLRFFIFAGFWLLLIAFRCYLLVYVLASFVLCYRLLFTDLRGLIYSFMKSINTSKRTLRKMHREPLREYKDLEGWRRLFFDLSILITSRICMLVIGVYNVQRHYISQLELTELQQQIRFEKEPPIYDESDDIPPFFIISNRVAAYDPIVIANEFGVVSFLSKRWIASLPILGDLARKISCVFSDDDIGGVMRIINDRAREYYRYLNVIETDRYAPRIAVFPEGTTTNGSQLIEFHKGPFTMGLPVQPVVIRYPFRHFNAAWLGSPSTLKYILLVMSQIFQSVEIGKK
jgi:1-acyl-sn-glycerol-3-phosphate acyltransferase